MFQEQYQRIHEKAVPDAALIDNMVMRARRQGHRAVWQRRLCTAAIAGACIFIGLPLASASSVGYQMMYAVSPEAAQFFTPVKRSDTDQGIRMEVESAYIHDNTVEIYVTLQDLEGSRIDESTDLFDSYSIGRPFSCAGGCFFEGYEEETGKARFLIRITEWGQKKIVGKKITFSVREILSGKTFYKDFLIPIDLSGVGAAQAAQMVHSQGGGGMGYDQYIGFDYDGKVRALVPGEPREEFPAEGIDMTGIGYIDGMLHIQKAVKDPLANDRHGIFYLLDAEGNRADNIYNFYRMTEDENGVRVDYEEQVFDIPQSELGEYQLYGDFVSGGELTKGDWRVTFPIEAHRNE